MNNVLTFSSKKQFYIRFPLGLVLILIFGVCPILISAVGAELSEMITGQICHEANCFWGGIFWYSFFTIPLALIFLMIWLINGFLTMLKFNKLIS